MVVLKGCNLEDGWGWKKKKNPYNVGILFLRVTSGIRTHDIQNHNLTL